MPYTTVEKDLF